MNHTETSPSLQNLAYLEQLWGRYRHDHRSVPQIWRDYFAGMNDAAANGTARLGPSFHPHSLFNPVATSRNGGGRAEACEPALHERLEKLIHDHRAHGHWLATLDPLGRPRAQPSAFHFDSHCFTESELDLLTSCPVLPYDQPLTVREIIERLHHTYCRSIGVEFMHIEDATARRWLQRHMESSQNQLLLSRDEQLRILTRLTEAVVFEKFLRTKFLGAKTFSLEGNESLVPLLDFALERAAELGVHRVVIGMAHRGRLNVLTHIVGKDPCELFREFADVEPHLSLGRGDVRYHLGHSSDRTTAGGRKIHLSLCFNPSHLEFVNPIVLGRVRAQQDRLDDRERRQVLGLLIHGDAAFAGEGIAQETLNFSRLPGYQVGGVLHVIINNQIGFTTPPAEGRSTPYATDVARLLSAPIFHVNGEDPEAVAQVARVAMDFRHEFQSDVFIDLYGYRRWGHNETDEPSFTEPLLYRAIEKRPGVREVYLGHLLERNRLTAEEAEKISHRRHEQLEEQLSAARTHECQPAIVRQGVWHDYAGGPEPTEEPDTSVPPDRLAALLTKLAAVPEGFHVHPKLERGLAARQQMAEGTRQLDWAAAEALAFATLATQEIRIRLTGQDTARGTFSQRHAILYDYETGDPHAPLQHLAADQAPVEIVNSPLNESGALGFEYGYSLDCPEGLVVWEAQFGDFINAAQVIVDQFISSAEDKWRRLSGLVLLLPHGFEGMGPEHSSARLERFLALAAEDNLQIVQPTTPAQYFHCLRRQALWRWRKPLVVFTPKSLLRHAKVISLTEDSARGRFQRVLADNAETPEVKRVLLCTGKVYYELAAHREEQRRDDIAILRLEQLYPLPDEILQLALAPYRDGTPVSWVQEEPENMGAWRYLRGRFGDALLGRWPLRLISRPESASPATGSVGAHKLEQAELIKRAFDDEPAKAAKPGPAKPSA